MNLTDDDYSVKVSRDLNVRTFSRTFSNDDGETTLKHTKKTSV